MGLNKQTDMIIVPLGSGGAILDIGWFLSYHDTKLVIQASEIKGKDGLLAYQKHWGFFKIEAYSKLRTSLKWGYNIVINEGNYQILGEFMVLSIMVPHFPNTGSGGMPPMPQTILMSVNIVQLHFAFWLNSCLLLQLWWLIRNKQIWF